MQRFHPVYDVVSFLDQVFKIVALHAGSKEEKYSQNSLNRIGFNALKFLYSFDVTILPLRLIGSDEEDIEDSGIIMWSKFLQNGH